MLTLAACGVTDKLDIIVGSSDADAVKGTDGKDVIMAFDGDDTLDPGFDVYNDIVNGGNGVDTAVIGADSIHYVIDKVGNRIDIEVTHGAHPLTHDYLNSIEIIEFNGVDTDVQNLWIDLDVTAQA